jgi:regulatory protein
MAQALRSKAIRLLARRERSHAELEKLLDPQGSNTDEVRAVLAELQSQGWLSEARLAEQVKRVQRERGSTARIRHEMARRGLPADVIATATAGLEADDLQAALALWRKRFGVATERAERERQLRFLLNRGFSRSLSLRVLRLAGAQDAIDSEE